VQLEAILQALSMLRPEVLIALLVGVVLCQIIVTIPGLGGSFVLVLVFPFAMTMDPLPAIAVLLGAAVVSGTGNTFTSVLFGVPGSSMGIASIFDGYPMARRGEASRALSAAFTASAVGGLFGAAVLALLIPVMRPVVLLFGPPEFFALVVVALVFISVVGTTDSLKALLAGGLGFMLAMVGQEPTTAALRYTYGQLYLWDGIGLVPFLIGLFAVSEMMRLFVEKGTISKAGAVTAKGQVLRGFFDVFRHWKATLQSSIVGVIVGMVPGLGGESAQFLAYSQVSRTSANRKDFGKGSVEGVIAADAATNAKEGGSLVPTLLLGIPGSSGMAILLLMLITIGVQPGRNLLDENLEILWFMVLLLVLASVLASVFCIATIRFMAKATLMPVASIIAPVMVVSFFGAYATKFSLGDLLVVFFSGTVGFLMVRYGYSRTTLVIGYVLGGLAEYNFLMARRIFGWSFLTRPIVMGLGVVLVITIFGPIVQSVIRARRARIERRIAVAASEREERLGS
jgi:putative tricarboxylic transport membrane protein